MKNLSTCKFVVALLLVLCFLVSASAQKRSRAKRIPTTVSAGVVTITTEPNAIVWIDDVRRGQTDATGKLELQNVSGKPHAVRVRALGFHEVTTSLLNGKR